MAWITPTKRYPAALGPFKLEIIMVPTPNPGDKVEVGFLARPEYALAIPVNSNQTLFTPTATITVGQTPTGYARYVTIGQCDGVTDLAIIVLGV